MPASPVCASIDAAQTLIPLPMGTSSGSQPSNSPYASLAFTESFHKSRTFFPSGENIIRARSSSAESSPFMLTKISAIQRASESSPTM
jgi:hypothetical protein